MSDTIACSICLDELYDDLGKLSECGHEFHLGCINQWVTVNRLCPLCRSPCSIISKNIQSMGSDIYIGEVSDEDLDMSTASAESLQVRLESLRNLHEQLIQRKLALEQQRRDLTIQRETLMHQLNILRVIQQLQPIQQVRNLGET